MPDKNLHDEGSGGLRAHLVTLASRALDFHGLNVASVCHIHCCKIYDDLSIMKSERKPLSYINEVSFQHCNII